MTRAVYAFFNTGAGMFFGYKTGDPMTASRLNPFVVNAESDDSALETVFSLMNADDRPNGQYERSLSVGDTAMVEQPDGTLKLYACESVGWKEIAK